MFMSETEGANRRGRPLGRYKNRKGEYMLEKGTDRVWGGGGG